MSKTKMPYDEMELMECCECRDEFLRSEMIRVSQFGYDKYHGDWCCQICAIEVFRGIELQLKERQLI